MARASPGSGGGDAELRVGVVGVQRRSLSTVEGGRAGGRLVVVWWGAASGGVGGDGATAVCRWRCGGCAAGSCLTFFYNKR
jgi:hypothetical protein